jgi:2,3-bisphosphoglycerate-independent phosphoglycerate mutase
VPNNQKKPKILAILDGWGIAPPSKGNAITLADTPNLDKIYQTYPSTTLVAYGESVGLDDDQISGSETGHVNIGAGKIVTQDSHFISESIHDGSFFQNKVLLESVEHVKKNKSRFHVMGLMGDSDSPHSNPSHFRAILKLAKENGIGEVYCHLFTDGRDSYPKSALDHLKFFRQIIREEGIGKIATISGRFYAMDRSKNWKRLVAAYEAIVFARGDTALSAEEAIGKAYKDNLTDEYVFPTVIVENGKPIAKLEDNDSIIFFNLRSDRDRQFSKLFVANNRKSIIADNMPIIDKIRNLYFVAMTNFGPDLNIFTVFPGHPLLFTLPYVLQNLNQLYIAEKEKYAHVTYFFNGGHADPVGGEDRVMVDSIDTDSYAKFPQMSAGKITEKVSESILSDQYEFITLNFANADMVGHTGHLPATIKAVETVDNQIGILLKIILGRGGDLYITADHGNADVMIDVVDGKEIPHTFHTINPVPFILCGEKLKKIKMKSDGLLGNIAPTLLEIMGIEKPEKMRCDSLIIK